MKEQGVMRVYHSSVGKWNVKWEARQNGQIIKLKYNEI
jgi:hypothetical protein